MSLSSPSVLKYGQMNAQMKRRCKRKGYGTGERSSVSFHVTQVSDWDRYFATTAGSQEAVELLEKIKAKHFRSSAKPAG